MATSLIGRRYFIPECVQTSAMDCGPASLKCLLEGFRIPASYGRLREACQTDVDGTSIDTLEDIAAHLGLDAEQILTPRDHILGTLPAILVMRQPSGLFHFVVLWRRHGSLLQVMDPSTGRRFVTTERFLEDAYLHEMVLPAESVLDWMQNDAFVVPLRRRMADVGCTGALSKIVDWARTQPGWLPMAALDAALRMVTVLVKGGAVRAGSEAEKLISSLANEAMVSGGLGAIPRSYWTARAIEDDPKHVRVKGALLVHVTGLRGESTAAEEGEGEDDAEDEGRRTLPRDLAAALAEPPTSVLKELYRALAADGWLAPSVLFVAMVAASLAAFVEALVLRSLFTLGQELGVVEQRLGALGALLLFFAVMLAVELPITHGLIGIGRRLEARMRLSFLGKLPRLDDRYMASRPTSDMAERSHTIHELRGLPSVASSLLRSIAGLVVTTGAVIWLDPPSAPFAIAAAIAGVVMPFVSQPLIAERDLRMKTHSGAISKYFFDALLGVLPVRTHGAGKAVRREYDALLVEWVRSARDTIGVGMLISVVQSSVGSALAVWLIVRYLQGAADPAGILLLVYWAMSIPQHGQGVAGAVRAYPSFRNRVLRLLEPLGAIEEARAGADELAAVRAIGPASIELSSVSVVAGGHAILQEVDLHIPAGSHIAVVGASGAGKSTIAGLLLGWHRASTGRVLVDGHELDPARLEALRNATAWVDPALMLWNKSLLENLYYGASPGAGRVLPELIEESDLRAVLERLPDGMSTELGEAGRFVSGGEGQRVRLARAMMRKECRLVILDEPFRGLDRHKRRQLLKRARAWWKASTLVCITHDVGETLSFDRVLVVSEGRIVEDGLPAELASRADSHLSALLEAEQAVRRDLWSGAVWRHLKLEGGGLRESDAADPGEPT